MKHISHYCLSLKSQAQGLGFTPAVWSAMSLINNDRTPEGTAGSEGDGYA